MVRVLFVCLGNVCRSPMAEAIFQGLVTEQGLEGVILVESRGTYNWHEGEMAHPRALEQLRVNGIPHSGRARQVTPGCLRLADYIMAMDDENVADLRRMGGEHSQNVKVRRLLDFAPKGSPSEVPDPYYEDNFAYVYRLIEASCRGLLANIRSEHEM